MLYRAYSLVVTNHVFRFQKTAQKNGSYLFCMHPLCFEDYELSFIFIEGHWEQSAFTDYGFAL
jgi:hypothetical protein